MTTTMRAVVLTEPGPVDNLHLRDLPIPQPGPGWVRIAVKAFGLNRSELHLRQGLADNASLPVVPGIEAVGLVDAAPGSDLRTGQQVAAMMGGMGRAYDGGYAEYTMVPARHPRRLRRRPPDPRRRRGRRPGPPDRTGRRRRRPGTGRHPDPA